MPFTPIFSEHRCCSELRVRWVSPPKMWAWRNIRGHRFRDEDVGYLWGSDLDLRFWSAKHQSHESGKEKRASWIGESQKTRSNILFVYLSNVLSDDYA